ncbi:stage II sporulation protein M [Novisyntrophococcus fermenticellae]|uniref:stage II sporulation protein M n=1 Tax=Novisyntrophococcus fermenticellae TaxID=2068655 RepID=UPI001E5D5454|nr:stage II sporulation protein M [Novisyntrophococcus fermenticellae]
MKKGFYRQYFYKFTRMPYGSIFLFLFLAGFLGGILFANVAWNIRPSAITGLNLLSAGTWITVDGSVKDYLKYLAGVRMKAPVMLMILGLTSFGMAAVYLGLLWYGFLGGLLCSAALLQLGLRGMLKLFGCLLLPMIFYVPAIALLLNQAFMMSEKSSRKEVENMGEYGRYLMLCILILAIFGLGILVECYVNPLLIEMCRKFF